MKKSFIITLLLLLCAPFTAYAGGAIIVNPANANSLDTDTIVKIYLGKTKSFPDGKTAIPTDIPGGTPLRVDYISKVVKKSESQFKSYWASIIFTGKGVPPQILPDTKAVKDLVARNPDSIGYIDASEVDATVKVVGSF